MLSDSHSTGGARSGPLDSRFRLRRARPSLAEMAGDWIRNTPIVVWVCPECEAALGGEAFGALTAAARRDPHHAGFLQLDSEALAIAQICSEVRRDASPA